MIGKDIGIMIGIMIEKKRKMQEMNIFSETILYF